MLRYSPVRLAVPSETRPGERRVATVPDVVARLATSGVETAVQAGAGLAASFADDLYAAKGATIAGDAAAVLADAQVVARVQPPTPEEAEMLPEGSSLVSFLQPAAQPEVVEVLVSRRSLRTASTCCPGSAAHSRWTPCLRRQRSRVTERCSTEPSCSRSSSRCS